MFASIRGRFGASGAKARVWARINSNEGSAKRMLTYLSVPAGVAVAGYLVNPFVVASASGVHPAKHPWGHANVWRAFDHASMRRGFQVYQEVCSACHSLNYICFRHLTNNTHTEAEAKALAQEAEIKDGPNDQGEYFMRPGKLSDRLPRPYENEGKARVANNGALPPDLSLIVKARHPSQKLTVGGEDYIFNLLLGYCDPPAGITIRDDMNFNPYFPGGAIGMARVLYDNVVDYADGTPATASQMAKDVVTFLAWAAEPSHDERKKLGIKVHITLFIATALAIYMKRFRWNSLKTRKIVYQSPHA